MNLNYGLNSFKASNGVLFSNALVKNPIFKKYYCTSCLSPKTFRQLPIMQPVPRHLHYIYILSFNQLHFFAEYRSSKIIIDTRFLTKFVKFFKKYTLFHCQTARIGFCNQLYFTPFF